MVLLEVEIQDNKFRVITQGFKTDWLPDTVRNRRFDERFCQFGELFYSQTVWTEKKQKKDRTVDQGFGK